MADQFGFSEGAKSLSSGLDSAREGAKSLTKSIENIQNDSLEVAQQKARERIRAVCKMLLESFTHDYHFSIRQGITERQTEPN